MVDRVNIVCMKWGTLYGPHYVNRLRAMVARHLDRPHRFVCFTDDAAGLDRGIETFDLPPIRVDAPWSMLGWRKLSLFNRNLADLSGTALFLDLDIVVVGALDPFFDFEPGRFCIIHNWTHPDQRIGNSSAYRFEIGADSYVLDRFHSEPHEHWVRRYRNSQTFLSDSVHDLVFWPDGWCVSFKKHCLPGGPLNWVTPATIPHGARIVVFHGRPNPEDVQQGRWPEPVWWKRPFKHVRTPAWLAEHWR
jgi:hypothetical protein